jgi:predicted site-specific integrase-resolvase
MSNLQSQMSPYVPTYLPLSDAAKKYGLSEKVLTQMVQEGKIEAVQLPTGDLLVAAEKNGYNDPQTKEGIITKRFAHLRGQRISAYAAQKGHSIHHKNFLNWARAGYIKILHEEEHLVEMDAADVAYCAYIYNQKKTEYGGRLAGVKIFDEIGNPYQVKYPDLSARRRR